MNAKKELLQHIGNKTLVCASIDMTLNAWLNDFDSRPPINLRVGHTLEEYNQFLERLDVEYDDGYGIQELGGTLWFSDGTWSDRGEYDGREWWQHHECPDIPEELITGELFT